MNALYFLSLNLLVFGTYVFAKRETIHEAYVFYGISGIFSLFMSAIITFSGIDKYFIIQSSGKIVRESLVSEPIQGFLVLFYIVFALYMIVKATTSLSDKEAM